MGHCQNMEDQLFNYLDDELDAFQKKEIKRHLDGCQECERFATRIGQLRKDMQNVRRIKASDSFHEQLRQRIQKENSKKAMPFHSFLPSRGWIPAVAFGVIIVISGAFFIDHQIDQIRQSNDNFLVTENSDTSMSDESQNSEALLAENESVKQNTNTAQDTLLRQKDLDDVKSRLTPVSY